MSRPDSLPDPSAAPAGPPAARSLAARILRRLDRVFVAAVLVPTAAAAVYYGFVASDIYESESRFIVRNAQHAGSPGIGALIQGSMLSKSLDDASAVHDFMLSRDALRELDRQLDLRKHFGASTNDLFSRFPAFDFDRSFEGLYRYYGNQIVTVDSDAGSAILVLKADAFDPQTALRINELLLDQGERLVNALNEKAQQDLIAVAQHEVKLAEDQVRATGLSLASFRTGHQVVDPTGQAALQLEGVAKIQQDLLAAQSQLEDMIATAPQNPQVPLLRQRVAQLQRALGAENAKLTGDRGSLATKSPVYDRLQLDQTLAGKQLAAAYESLETARSEARRKQLYLERLVQPNLQDKADQPHRLRGVLTVLIVGLVAWGILRLIIASVREHVD